MEWTKADTDRWNDAYEQGWRAGQGSGQFVNHNPYLGKPDQLLEMNAWQMGFDYHLPATFYVD